MKESVKKDEETEIVNQYQLRGFLSTPTIIAVAAVVVMLGIAFAAYKFFSAQSSNEQEMQRLITEQSQQLTKAQNELGANNQQIGALQQQISALSSSSQKQVSSLAQSLAAAQAKNQELQSTTQSITQKLSLTQENVSSVQQSLNQTNQQVQGLQSQPTDVLGATLINAVEATIVEINCFSAGGRVISSGSGSSISTAGKIGIMTNLHIGAAAYTPGVLPTCYATYPKPPDFIFDENYGDYMLVAITGHFNLSTYEDSAFYMLGTPLSGSVTLNSFPSLNNVPGLSGAPAWSPDGPPICNPSDVNVGNRVTVFGYPASGNLQNISETVTDGIISGINPGPYYKTTAPIDHGNSGGIAILNKNKCIVGIPTLGSSGLTAGIGYIQSIQLALQPTN